MFDAIASVLPGYSLADSHAVLSAYGNMSSPPCFSFSRNIFGFIQRRPATFGR